jgi:hypothetical protein
MKRDHAMALRAFDYFASVIFGVGAALSAWLLVPGTLSFVPAMLLAMVAGTVAVFPLLGLFMVLLGGFEILMMSLQIGMIGGMVGGMIGGMAVGGTIWSVLLAGSLTGLTIQSLLHVSDRQLHGPVKHDGPVRHNV